ncbi:adenylate/guanylate cyclase domain-containing protein [Algoriphagus resistens]|uniref:adenylate/guanylate cyclase domain-containing protein n=1 Tax=Algoriphagus resistens TaxID=1750590 RepID=UPI000716ADEA|nr:adenylate/guanylate cyclase domain-containing protein [Algoriphagus resistens]
MLHRFEYTSLAQDFTARFPFLSYVGTQVSYWIIANLLLFTIVRLLSQIIAAQYRLPELVNPGALALAAVGIGILYGVSLGGADYLLDRNFFRKLPLGKVILIKAFGSVALLSTLFLLMCFVLFDFLSVVPNNNSFDLLNEKSWEPLFYLLLVYYFFMTLIINFANQVNKKYGPGVLAPLLLGRYRDPKQEARIFMFMDLKSSTSLAEQLGHLNYSAFIRDSFSDINKMLFPFRAQVYQYVGDEVVVSWPALHGMEDHRCVRFYFACKKQFESRGGYYRSNYGRLPEFKAGIHMGMVTAVEIGEIKRDIAYHGDTLNTAARIQGVCNDYKKELIISGYLLSKVGPHPSMDVEMLGMILLRGKTKKIGIMSVDWIDQKEN